MPVLSELCNLPASADGYDVYVGQKAGINSKHGFANVFVGVHTGTSCYGAGCRQDVIIGQAAMNGAITNSPGIALTQSVIIGGGAFNGNTPGGTNAGDNFIGQFSGALAYNVSNSNCFGLYSCASLASGNGITAFGDHVAQNTTVGGGSFFGASTGSNVTTGINLSLFGNSVGTDITTGSDDSCFGNGACYYLGAANQSSVFGSGAGHIMSVQNDLFGYSAGSVITTGTNNVAVGSQSLHADVTGIGNVAVGYEAAHGTTSQGNTDIGDKAGYSATSGAENTLVGYNAGFGITTGADNVIVGGDHVPSNPLTTGSNNEALGWGAFLGPAVSGAVQFGNGTNSISNTVQYQSVNFLTSMGVGTFPSAVGVSVTAELVPTPSAPAITTAGSAGTTTDTYLLVGRAVSSTGFYSAASATASIATANATLSSTNYNVITFPAPVAGISCYDVYRTVSGGAPATTGKIASCQTVSYHDHGAPGDGTTAPASATGGYLYDAVYTVATLPSTCTAGQKANVSDASSPTYLGTLTGGSTTFTPVVCRGSNTWISY